LNKRKGTLVIKKKSRHADGAEPDIDLATTRRTTERRGAGARVKSRLLELAKKA